MATASLELGIDIGSIDLVCQIGSPRSIATFLQRVGRSGHALGVRPKGRIFPGTRDELVESAALTRAVRAGRLDKIVQPVAPLDVLAQQIVAECAAREWNEDELFDLVRRAAPYRDLARKDYDEVLAMLASGVGEGAGGSKPLLHRDRIAGVLRARRASRMVRNPERRHDPRAGRLPRDRRTRRDRGRHGQRGLGDREHGEGRLPPRQYLVAHPPHRERDGAGRGRARCAADDPVLARRGPRPHDRAERGGRPPAPRDRRGPRRCRAAHQHADRGDGRGPLRRAAADRLHPRHARRARHRADRHGRGLRALLRRVGAGCSSSCTRRSDRGSTAPGASRCASASACASTSSCRPRPTTTGWSSRSGRSTASPSRSRSPTSPRATSRKRCGSPASTSRSSRRAGAGTRRGRSPYLGSAVARRCSPTCSA